MSRREPSPPPRQRADGWWSDGETSALIDAWGPLYVARNRGPLPIKENGVAACCPAEVVAKLAEVYERVELARLDVEKKKMAMATEKVVPEAVKVKEEKLDDA
ncbi:hypothetical protein E2562_037448 [Oryza meyeriana var. granulata]|uniref:Uncharacterized protein n=1 Tax=Oryza meyeriana var. granulata TaxID=110450 RepID=A0A6G1FGB6_9ORYZ|nr:hypothetical protein E2562_037448 [Oryza meyeriana var. granulata]